jgi:hypothetical protein
MTPRRAWLLGAALLAAACFGRGPRPELFTLAPGAGAPLAALPELGLVVGPLELPRYLDRPEIVTRDGARLLPADGRRWGGSLRNDVLRVVSDDLGTLLGTARVAYFPNEPAFDVDYRVRLDLREFAAVPGGPLALRLHWTVVGSDGRALAVDASEIQQPLASAAYADLVAAQSAALAAVSRTIAERIAALEAGR